MLPMHPIFSCDTLVATGAATADGVALFAKNSDREPNEAQAVTIVPAKVHPPNATVQLTNIKIPQADHTHGVVLSRPFWMWGAEMGVNDKGVAIGNEAVFTKIAYDKKPGLIGMDMLRLGLERSSTAEEAVHVLTGLLEKYGQGGNCGYKHKLYYHNSFIIADAGEAFVLETAGKHWALKKIKDVYSISNGLTITNDWDEASADLVNLALEKGWCNNRSAFSFRDCYSDFLYTKFSDCRKRRSRTMQLLKSQTGRISTQTMMNILRDHGAQAGAAFRPDKGLTGATVCMHAGFGPIRGSQTVGSLVSHLHPEHPTHFVTGTAAPCTSTFKPVWLDAAPELTAPSEYYDDESLFWRHELLHRQMLSRPHASETFQAERDALETEIASEALHRAALDAETRTSFSQKSFESIREFEDKWLDNIRMTGPGSPAWLHHYAWKNWNRQAKIFNQRG